MKRKPKLPIRLSILAIAAALLCFPGKIFSARAVPVNPAETNEYSGKEQFTEIPYGTSVADVASGVWNDLPEYSCNNLNVGKNVNGTFCTYRLMWNDEKLFFAVKAKDLTWNDDDMIEIGLRYRDQNWGYLFATMAPWVGAGAFGNGGMTFIDFEKDENEKTRTIYFTADLKDKSMLREKESLLMNVNYYDYGDRVNGEKNLICRLQSGVAASGDPCTFYPLVGRNTADCESPDNTLYDEVFEAYENLPESGSSETVSDSTVSGSESLQNTGGCNGSVGNFGYAAGPFCILCLFAALKTKKYIWRK
ncbi:MAG: hypothetical protein SOT34_03620 [Candidatus Borkfalkiaceae bacterium]|nr:hypothetical protein [Christensenellaceae bacterium]